MDIAVIGAGLAGLACAERLVAAGRAVTVFDRGRAPGGRMSTRRQPTAAGEAAFDHGAQYFTARDPAFMAQVEHWRAAGLVAPWSAAGPDAWVGTPAMNTPVRAIADRLDVRSNARVDRLRGGWRLEGDGMADARFDTVLVAVAAEQAALLLDGWDGGMAARARATPSLPCWTVMAALPDRLPVAGDILREHGAVGWAARNSAKPGRAGPESWVIQAGPDWSARHIEDTAEAVLRDLLAAFADRVGAFAPPVYAQAHRWRYARSGAAGEGLLWNGALRLGVCGDWLLGPRVECAWLSGVRLAEAVVAADA